jgi:hypothetical protein
VYKKLTILGALTLFSACSTSQHTLTSLSVNSLKALDLEEDLSGSDELMMAYSLTSFDEKGKAIATINGSWGIQETKKNQKFTEVAFRPIELEMPKNGRIMASLVLIEVDDYEKALKTLDGIKRYHEIVKIPAGIAELADVTQTPLKYISIGLSAVGVGFKLVDRLDQDDLLGQHKTELSYAKALTTPVVHVPLKFTGKNLGSSYDYELAYDLRSKTIKVKSKGKN